MAIKILDYEYKTILTDKPIDNDALTSGCHNSTDMSITISTNFPKQVQETTLIHEVIEAINYHLELGLKHSQISSLEVGFMSFLKSNDINITTAIINKNFMKEVNNELS